MTNITYEINIGMFCGLLLHVQVRDTFIPNYRSISQPPDDTMVHMRIIPLPVNLSNVCDARAPSPHDDSK